MNHFAINRKLAKLSARLHGLHALSDVRFANICSCSIYDQNMEKLAVPFMQRTKSYLLEPKSIQTRSFNPNILHFLLKIIHYEGSIWELGLSIYSQRCCVFLLKICGSCSDFNIPKHKLSISLL